MSAARISWQDIRSRLPRRISGLEIAGFGVEWDYGPDEKKIVEEAITYIENVGVFYAPFEWEHPKETYSGAQKARDDLTQLMQRLDRKMRARESLETIRSALRDFQREVRRLGLVDKTSKSELSNNEVYAYDAALVRLREVSGAVIAHLAATFHLTVSDELDLWLRPVEQDS